MDLKQILKGAGASVGVIVGIAVLILLLILGGLTLYGMTWVADKIYPIVETISVICIPIVLIAALLSIIRNARPVVSSVLVISSYIFGATLWLFSILTVYSLWGLTWLVIGLLIGGIGVVPLAFLASLFKGEWSSLLDLVFLLFFTFGSRFFGLYLSERG